MSEVLFVGTSDAFGAGGRRQSAILVRGERGTLLLDCGATTGTGLQDLGVERDEIEVILVSHFHGDHFGGIPLFLLAALYQDQRRHAIHIAGPPDIENRVRALAHAMGHSIEDQDWSFPIHFNEVLPGGQTDLGPAQVRAFETKHQIEAHPQGYRLEVGGPTIAYSGDTGWFPELPRLSADADLFICECTLHRNTLDFHLDLGTIEAHQHDFACGRLVLTHLGAEMAALRGDLPIDTADDGLLIRL